MAECQIGIFAVVCRHTRVAHTAKRNPIVHDMHNRIVDTRAARRSMFEDMRAMAAEVV